MDLHTSVIGHRWPMHCPAEAAPATYADLKRQLSTYADVRQLAETYRDSPLTPLGSTTTTETGH